MKRNDSIIPKKYDLARFKGSLTERTFYGVFKLSCLPIRKILSVLSCSNRRSFRREQGGVENLSDLFHCLLPFESNLTIK